MMLGIMDGEVERVRIRRTAKLLGIMDGEVEQCGDHGRIGKWS